MTMNPVDTLDAGALERPNDTAFFWKGETWTYARLQGDVNFVAAYLSNKGIDIHDRIALHLPNSPHLLICLLACFRLGAVAVPINNRFKAQELTSVFQRVEPRYYIGSKAFESEILRVGETLIPANSRLIFSTISEFDREAWQSPAVDSSDMIRGRRSSPDDVMLLLPTSGTTGDPKVVIHTAKTLSAVTKQYQALGLQDDDIMLTASPIVHAGGLFNFLSSLRRTGPMVMLGAFDAHSVLDEIEARRCTWFKGLPFMFDQLARAQTERYRDTSSLRLCVSSGDVCSAKVQRDFLDLFGCPLSSAWACTEAATSLAICPKDNVAFLGSPSGRYRITDETGLAVPRTQPGELWVEGPNVSPGYWISPSEIERHAQGWFRTGDIMSEGNDGALRFFGRQKNLIIKGGSNISPVEVETAIRAHPDVQDAAVFGIPDEQLGETLGALIEAVDVQSFPGVADILQATRHRISDYKVPDHAIAVGQIPRAANGKIDRKSLLEIFYRETANSVRPATKIGHSR